MFSDEFAALLEKELPDDLMIGGYGSGAPGGAMGGTAANSNGTAVQSGVNGLMENSQQPSAPQNNNPNDVRPPHANQQLSSLLQNKNPTGMSVSIQQNQHSLPPQSNMMVNSLNSKPPMQSSQNLPNMVTGPVQSSVPHSLNDTMSGMNNLPSMAGGHCQMVTSMSTSPMTSTSMTGHMPMSSAVPAMSNTLTSMSGNITSMPGQMASMNKGMVTSMAPGSMVGGQLSDGVMTNGPLPGMPPQGMVASGIRGPISQTHVVGRPMGPRHPGMPGQMPRLQVINVT